jgi:hypothetical protein
MCRGLTTTAPQCRSAMYCGLFRVLSDTQANSLNQQAVSIQLTATCAMMLVHCRCLAKASAIAPEAPRTLTTTALMLIMSLLQSTELPQCAQQSAQSQREPSERKLLQFARSCCAAQTQLQQLCATSARSGGWCDSVDAGVVHEVSATSYCSSVYKSHAFTNRTSFECAGIHLDRCCKTSL